MSKYQSSDDQLIPLFVGVLIGILASYTTVCLYKEFDKTKLENNELMGSAVKLGYARWLVDTNYFVGTNPPPRFQWITNVSQK